MKTPWKFLVDLASRRASAKPRQGEIWQAPKIETVEGEPERPAALPVISTDGSEAAGRNQHSPIAQVPEVSTSADNGLDITPPFGGQVAAESAGMPGHNVVPPSQSRAKGAVQKKANGPKEQSRRPVERRQRTKANADKRAAPGAVAKHEQQGQHPSSFEHPSGTDVESLDAEIKRLRSLLAQKIRLQNMQLKKMLERFGVS